MQRTDRIRLQHMLVAARIDLDILWNTTIRDLPILIHEIERALNSMDE